VKDRNSLEGIRIYCKLNEIKEELINLGRNAPVSSSKSRGIKKRFEEYPEIYFTFMDDPEVEPTNNHAERSLRKPVIFKKINQGIQSPTGNLVWEAKWSAVATLSKQGRKIIPFLEETFDSYFEGKPVPSLLNPGKPVAQKYIELAKEEREQLRRLEKENIKARKAGLPCQARPEVAKPFNADERDDISGDNNSCEPRSLGRRRKARITSPRGGMR
jgi:hypothetical protein